ncbi:hypothetical protein SXCC_04823 [Gluconacetobacter sp. SXCC-1]|uniref:hypothetical protein n=1 Tax=Komagataeibacter rhaeticus TaxID=215221 RepID=UPI000207FB34|nr:hypothetical protein [Komagataeibacter rhaeticus]ATU72696.1 hypothetical protein CT154_07385 [Komagataeibacter xylinus]EGG74719.1 hypothetical protein SXCC_04823 [Gluconacetobacter sp. SXCC-1]WPP22461.1 hypothetical protein SCD25_02890 [Komagataeibacter rhaeticus]
MRILRAVVCLLGLSACAHQAPVQTTIPDAMAGIQASLARAGAISVSHAADWTPDQTARFKQAVRAAQCSQGMADPVIGTVVGNVTLELSGAFTQGGQFTVGAVTTAPTVGIGGSASRTRGQQISLPVAYTPLSSLPDVEMSRQVGYETEMLAQNDDARHSEAMRLVTDREKLRARVTAMIDNWPLAHQCLGHENVVPFVGVRR